MGEAKLFCQQKKKKRFCFLLLGVGITFPVGYVWFPPDLFSRFSDFVHCLCELSVRTCAAFGLFSVETVRINRVKDDRAGKGHCYQQLSSER